MALVPQDRPRDLKNASYDLPYPFELYPVFKTGVELETRKDVLLTILDETQSIQAVFGM